MGTWRKSEFCSPSVRYGTGSGVSERRVSWVTAGDDGLDSACDECDARLVSLPNGDDVVTVGLGEARES